MHVHVYAIEYEFNSEDILQEKHKMSKSSRFSNFGKSDLKKIPYLNFIASTDLRVE